MVNQPSLLEKLQPVDTIRREMPKLGRNKECFCGSGKKYKKCCLLLERAISALEREQNIESDNLMTEEIDSSADMGLFVTGHESNGG